jgi:hypothetical protein
VTGKKTGTQHTFPVMYARDGESFVIVAGWASKKRWWKNLAGGADVELLVAGATVHGRATALVDDPSARGRAIRAYLARFPKAASTLGISAESTSLDDAALGGAKGDAVVVRASSASDAARLRADCSGQPRST